MSPCNASKVKSAVYEASTETEAAIARIHGHFESSGNASSEEKKRRSSPEGVLRSTLQALLTARKAMAIARGKNLTDQSPFSAVRCPASSSSIFTHRTYLSSVIPIALPIQEY